MKALSLSNFKKMKEDKKMVVMVHPSGHQINILKSAISPLQRKQIEKLPIHAAEGDPSVGGGGSEEAQSDDQTANQMLDQQPAPDQTTSVPVPNAAEPTPSIAPPPAQGGNSAPQAQAIPSTESPVNINASYEQGQQAITEKARADQQLAANKGKIEQQEIQDKQALNDTLQQNTQEFAKHQQQFMSDYMNNHIDPNHYVENMGSVQKVGTAIGLILGGFTGGFNKTGVNPAADWLNSQINRDIDAQKSRLDQQKTIFGANQELYHDQVIANNATRINMNDIYDHKIQQAADQLGTPQAKANADAMHSDFAMKNSQLLQTNAIRATALQTLKNGGAGIDPITLQNAQLMSPEEATKEQTSINVQKQGISNINNLYDQANKEQTAANLLNPQSYKRIGQINASIRDAILSTDTAHRVSPDLAKNYVDPFLIKTTDDAETRAQKQQGALNKIKELTAGGAPIMARLAPAAMPKYQYLNQDEKAVQWAKQNPSDPRASAILQKNGLNGPTNVAR